MVGDMSTSEGIQLARSRGLDLVLEDFHQDPPLCRITNEIPLDKQESSLRDSKGFAFDPSVRPATIRFSSNIDDLELERKVDILRKHLLEKKRCEIVIIEKGSTDDSQDAGDLLRRILRDVAEIGKSPDSHELERVNNEFRIRIWPCRPDQGESPESVSLRDRKIEHADEVELKGHPRKFRHIRSRTDPKLIRHTPKSVDSD
jgi:translation initiation factor IF-3